MPSHMALFRSGAVWCCEEDCGAVNIIVVKCRAHAERLKGWRTAAPIRARAPHRRPPSRPPRHRRSPSRHAPVPRAAPPLLPRPVARCSFQRLRHYQAPPIFRTALFPPPHPPNVRSPRCVIAGANPPPHLSVLPRLGAGNRAAGAGQADTGRRGAAGGIPPPPPRPGLWLGRRRPQVAWGLGDGWSPRSSLTPVRVRPRGTALC